MIELLIQMFGAHPSSWFRDLGQPLAAMAGSINRGASTRNRPAAIQGFDPVHRARHLLADREIAPPQFFQRAKSVFPVIHRLELVGS